MLEENKYQPEFDEYFLARWMANELTDDELKQFESHPDHQLYAQIASSSQSLKVDDIDLQANYARIVEKRNAVKDKVKSKEVHSENIKAQENNPKISRRILLAISVAAASICLIVWATFLRPNMTMIDAGMMAVNDIELPDGSRVQLNALSQLTYDAKKFDGNRTVSLKGEAFFDVKKGASFNVVTENGSVLVLGTSFNVKSLDGGLAVHCKSGRVKVSNADSSQDVVLKQNESIAISDQILGQKKSLDSMPMWMSVSSAFESSTMQEVIERFKEVYPVSFTINDVDVEEKFTGMFVHGDLKKALEMVFPAMDITYERNNNQIVLSSK